MSSNVLKVAGGLPIRRRADTDMPPHPADDVVTRQHRPVLPVTGVAVGIALLLVLRPGCDGLEAGGWRPRSAPTRGAPPPRLAPASRLQRPGLRPSDARGEAGGRTLEVGPGARSARTLPRSSLQPAACSLSTRVAEPAAGPRTSSVPPRVRSEATTVLSDPRGRWRRTRGHPRRPRGHRRAGRCRRSRRRRVARRRRDADGRARLTAREPGVARPTGDLSRGRRLAPSRRRCRPDPAARHHGEPAPGRNATRHRVHP